LTERGKGTPQGGVLSPLLANLFLHYAFDVWMRRDFPQTPFERYADDANRASHGFRSLLADEFEQFRQLA
jgi:retron-type reverse transcriptase